jgi:hypothetical protein
MKQLLMEYIVWRPGMTIVEIYKARERPNSI